MAKLRRETGLEALRSSGRILALAAAGALGRAAVSAAVDGFLLYVFGDPATEGHRGARRPPTRAASVPEPGSVTASGPSGPNGVGLSRRRAA